jgi:HK97 family phage prohead protease
MDKKEIRTMELRAMDNPPDNNMIVEGYAVVYDAPTVMYEFDGIKYYEVIARGALDSADMTDVPMKYNHSDDIMIMARTRNKTLSLAVDDKGLFISANLAQTSAGKDLYELTRRGDIDKMSFAFTVAEETYNKDTRTRTITRFKKIYDVAAVDMAAYSDTSISARSFFELENEKERKALENAELRKKLKLKTLL